ncbi:MFS transporter [Paenibacillus riograndensis]|uniref:Mfs transporter n=1 Tax=Paenibacillus riograndensis SBR5 TaxID=1073571 RepID=A0A0E4CX98_9BACL|nr:MFS transporter [Paenibacillus riograndensis]CQR56136.1 mfs transporter [Paenibacillus riograndensis SBR5]
MPAKTVIWVIASNRPGVLARVSQSFAGCETNIERVSFGRSRDKTVARMRIAFYVEDKTLEAILHSLGQLKEVIQVRTGSSTMRALSYWAVAYGLFVTILGLNLAAPLYSVYRTQWDLSPAMVVLVFAAYALVVIPSIVLFGQVSDRIGPVRILLCGIAATLSGSLCFLFANGLSMLLLARVLQGLAVGMFNGVAVSAMTELHKANSKRQAAYLAALLVTAGNALGPVLSGILAEYTPWPTRMPFLVHLLLVVPAVIGLLLVRIRSEPAGTASLHWPRVPAGIRGAFYTASLTSFLVWGVVSLFMSVVPTYLGVWVDRTGFLLSGLLAAGVLGFSALGQFTLGKLPLLRMMTAGYACLLLGLAGLVLALRFHSLIILFASILLVGMGHGPLYAGSLAYVNAIAPSEARGDTVSFFYTGTYIGVAVPVLGLGLLSGAFGLERAIEGFAGWMGLCACAGYLGWRRIINGGISNEFTGNDAAK